MDQVELLSRSDLRAMGSEMNQAEISHLVGTYYQVQDFRKAASNMAIAQEKEHRPHQIVQWVSNSQENIEKNIRIALEAYASSVPAGQWLLSQHGIGPVIAAGLLSYIDINKAPTAGHIWSFAGLDPSQKWNKGEKRPWNAKLKELCWKIGDSFVKTSGSSKSFYGHIYKERKIREIEMNEAGAFSQIAAATLKEKRIKEAATRKAYEAGKLPPGRIDMRARRVAVKLFLSHFHDVLTWYELGRRAPEAYVLSHMGHVHKVECPNAPWELLVS